MLKVGVIGLGVGEQHLLGYSHNKHCEVVAVCDWDQSKLDQIRLRYPEVRTTDNATELLTDRQVDIVSIASHDDDHFHQVCAAMDHDKHVFVEKPLCQSFDQLRIIQEKWQRRDGRLKLKSNLVLRAAPLYRWLRALVSSGGLGKVYAVDGDYLYGRLSKLSNTWRSRVDDYSVMAGGGIHLIDLLLWLIGERPRTIHTVANKICTEGSDFRYADFAAATMTFDSGLIARVTANFGCVHGHQHVIRLFGTGGTFLYDDRGPRYQKSHDPAPPATPVAEAALPHAKYALIDDFVDAIVEDRDLTLETRLDFDVLSVCAASDSSLRSQHVCEVQYL